MKYSVETRDDITLIILKGSLEGGEDTFAIKDEVTKKLEEGGRKFIIDMEKTGFVNSTGIGVIVAIHTSVKDNGGQLKICNVSDKSRRAFVVTGVWSMFSTYDSRDEAIGAFKG